MAQPITSIRKILNSLNGEGKNTPWVVIPSLYTLTEVGISPINGKVDLQNQGVILKIFVNVVTGEVKTFLAKLIEDIPERSLMS